MSCGKNCKCKSKNVGTTAKVTPIEVEAHLYESKEGDMSFLVSCIDGQIFLELSICEELPEITALFPVNMDDEDKFCVYVPDYVADINEEFLAKIDVIPVIVDDVEYIEDEDDLECDSEDEDDCCSADEELEEADKLLAAIRTAQSRAGAAIAASEAAGEEDPDMEAFEDAMNAMVDDIAARVYDRIEEIKKAGDELEKQRSAKLGAGLVGCRIGDMPVGLQRGLARSLGFPEDEVEKIGTDKRAEAVDEPEQVSPSKNKPCASGVRWSPEEDKELLKLGAVVGSFDISWDAVAVKLGRTADACRKRFYKIKGSQK